MKSLMVFAKQEFVWMMKIRTPKFVFCLIIILFIPYASAQDGCFVYPESSFYCTDTSLEKAKQECAFDEKCVFLSAFIEGESCANKDAFPQCQKIICKSSCREEFVGKCVGGEVPAGKEQEWCSQGCCQFSYFGGSFCDYQENKWRCEVEAKNREVVQFLFAFPMDETNCRQQCSQGTLSVEKFTENVTATSSLPSSESGKETLLTDSLLLEWMLLLIFLTGLVYFAHVIWRYSNRAKLTLPAENTIEEKSDWAVFGILKSRSKNLQKLHSTHLHKKKHQEHDEILHKFSSTTGKKDAFSKLHDLTFNHKFKKEKTAFENLEHLSAAMNKKQASLEGKKESQKALEKLKEIVKKK
ncbi:hypothetical protein HYV87_00790 [Candidatus Woesearchaeota archaeon]|nr:hypothetical protein [Candidatus Woesearchaeota archaeon]